MHGGRFVGTPTPPLSGRRTPHPSPVRVCLFSFLLAGSGGPASWARSGAPHLSFGRFVLLLCLAPSGLGLPLSCPLVCLCSFLPFFFSFPLSAPPLSFVFCGFRPRVYWALALSAPVPPRMFFLSCSCFLPSSLVFVAARWVWCLLPAILLFLLPPPPFLGCFLSPPLLAFSALCVLPLLLSFLAGLWLPPPPPPLVCISPLLSLPLGFLPPLCCSCCAPASLLGVRLRFRPPAASPPPPRCACSLWCFALLCCRVLC